MSRIPVLLAAYKRPRETAVVLNRLRVLDEHFLRIVVDAPRRKQDIKPQSEVVALARAHLKDHPGELVVRSENRGLRIGLFDTISNFLSDYEEGVILEDDTVPAFDFFPFAAEMLDRFRSDQRIGMVSGNYHAKDGYFLDSYGFSRNKATWGWATWARAWRGMSVDPSSISGLDIPRLCQNLSSFMGVGQERHWGEVVRRLRTEKVDAWDWYWFLHLARNAQLSVVPSVNLVSNIGFGPEATHTFGKAKREYLETGALSWPLTHPSEIIPSIQYERAFEVNKYFYADLRQLAHEQTGEVNARLFKSPLMTRLQAVFPNSRFRSFLRRQIIRYKR